MSTIRKTSCLSDEKKCELRIQIKTLANNFDNASKTYFYPKKFLE